MWYVTRDMISGSPSNKTAWTSDAEQKKNVMVYNTGTCTWYVRCKHFTHDPAIPLNTWLPRLARSTLNDLQQNQHEKASLVCVRVQSPSELALVPCALSMVDLSGQLRCWITHTCLVQKNVLFSIFGTLCSYDPLWRGFFFPWKTKEKMALFSRAPHDYWK